MENIESIQEHITLTEASDNRQEETEFKDVSESHVTAAPDKHVNTIQFGGTLEQVCMTVMAVGLATVFFIETNWLRAVIAVVCSIVFIAPFLLKSIRSHRGISAEKACTILKKRGFSPVIAGDEIHWISNGKECILRIHSHCQIEIAREYDIPPIQAAIDGNEKAALETMKEVYLAKVAVRSECGSSRLAFSTESLCVSAKELSMYLPMCLDILDLAESRQREHIAEIRESLSAARYRKIGFTNSSETNE